MSPKIKTIFTCSTCDAQFPKWLGRCGQCGAWGTVAASTPRAVAGGATAGVSGNVISFSEVSGDDVRRMPTGIGEFDRVVGGGIAVGSVILLGGEPGIGKSTLVLQIAHAVAVASGKPVLYISGEESAGQIKDRIIRLGLDAAHFSYLDAVDATTIAATIGQHRPALAIVDSIQTIRSAEVAGESGSLAQVKASTAALAGAAKATGTAVVLIGHITKTGAVAGPKTLEHLVDTVLYLESEGAESYRLLRAAKNRFGGTAELGVFEMHTGGLREVTNPAAMFLTHTGPRQLGSVITPVLIGARVFLAEVQALVAWARFGYPQRKTVGFDANRLNLLATVLDQRLGIRLNKNDIHVKIAGGLRITDPGADLAVVLAIASAQRQRAVDQRVAVCGEVGLGGEIRPVPKLEQRVAESVKLGFTTIVVPKTNISAKLSEACLPAATVADALRELWG